MEINREEFFALCNQLYQEKQKPITFKEICNNIGCCEKTLRRALKQHNAYEDMPDVFRTIMKPLHQFDSINEESAYWLGYLLADGCLAEKTKNSKALMLECKTDDVEILIKFCNFLDIRPNRITVGHNGASRCLSVADSNFSTSVTKYGIVANKSHKETRIPLEVLNDTTLFLQFFKGLVDGDGTIHTSPNSPGVSIITNSLTLAIQLKKQLALLLPEPSSIWITTKLKEFIPRTTQNLYTLKVGSGLHKRSNLKYLYDMFYKNNLIILTRKEQALKSLLK